MLVELSEELLNLSNLVESALQAVKCHLENLTLLPDEREQLAQQFCGPSSQLQQRAVELCKWVLIFPV